MKNKAASAYTAVPNYSARFFCAIRARPNTNQLPIFITTPVPGQGTGRFYHNQSKSILN